VKTTGHLASASKPVRHSGLPRAAANDCPTATNAGVGQSAPALVVKGGKIVRRDTAKRARVERVPVVLTERLRQILVTSPLVREEITFRERLIIAKAARAMMGVGLSQNRAADTLGVSRSQLSAWLAAFKAGGADSLRPAGWNGGRPATDGKAKRHGMFLEFVTSP
jgi:hypothetical protein